MKTFQFDPPPTYMSRGTRIKSVLSGEGVFELLPGSPDVTFDQKSRSVLDKFDPEIDFDPNSFSRMDKFDGLEVGQELVDSALDKRPASSASSDAPAEGTINQQ